MRSAPLRRRLTEMKEERDHLLASIVDLDHEHEIGEIDHDDYVELRRAYTSRAAAALRAIEDAEAAGGDEGTGAQDTRAVAGRQAVTVQAEDVAAQAAVGSSAQGEDASSPSATGAPTADSEGIGPRKRRSLRRWGLAFFAGAFAAGAVVVAFTVATSGANHTSTSATPDVGVVVQDLSQARSLLARGDDAGALDLYNKVLVAVPHQAEALAYRGWILRQAGVASGDHDLLASGQASVEQAVSADPSFPDAHAFLGYIRLQDQHDPAASVAQFRQFLADHPPAAMVALTKDVVAQAFAAVHQPVPAASPPPG